MEKRELLYEGKAKKLFLTDDENLVISEFKDDLTAFNGEKNQARLGKARLTIKFQLNFLNFYKAKEFQLTL